MKYYKKMIELQVFNRQDITKIVGNENTASSLILQYQHKGLIKKVKRNLYATVSLETDKIIASPYKLATKLGKGNYISHWSALEFLGYTDVKCKEIYVTGPTRFNHFDFSGISFYYIRPQIDVGIRKIDGVAITDLERTVLDNINDFEKMFGLDELLTALKNIKKLSCMKLLDYLEHYNKPPLWKRAGYVLSQLKDSIEIPRIFFAECAKHIPNTRNYLYKDLRRENTEFDERWRLYVPEILGNHSKKETRAERLEDIRKRKKQKYFSSEQFFWGGYNEPSAGHKVSRQNWTWEKS